MSFKDYRQTDFIEPIPDIKGVPVVVPVKITIVNRKELRIPVVNRKELRIPVKINKIGF